MNVVQFCCVACAGVRVPAKTGEETTKATPRSTLPTTIAVFVAIGLLLFCPPVAGYIWWWIKSRRVREKPRLETSQYQTFWEQLGPAFKRQSRISISET